MKKVAIVFGGQSAEHEVSVNSAKNIYNALDKTKYEAVLLGVSKSGSWYHFESASVFSQFPSLFDDRIQAHGSPVALISDQGRPYVHFLKSSSRIQLDSAFPIIHGTHGEDGCIQGYFKMMNLPFVGCGVLASSAAMDKDVMKKLFISAGIKTPRFVTMTRKKMKTYEQLSEELGSPFFIKPVNMGSSVGVHKVKSAADYATKIEDAFLYDHKVIVEEFIEGRELECSVLGHTESAKASVAGEVKAHHEFYSYEAKYLDANGASIIIPCELENSKMEELRALAVKTFEALNCEGLTRVDFFMKKNGDLYVNEINTLPGFTQISMYPKMWEATGIIYSDLISQLIELAFQKHESDAKLKTSFDAAVK